MAEMLQCNVSTGNVWLFALLIFLTIPPIHSLGQNIPVGTWRTHASYRSVHSVAITGEKIYAGTTGGLFYFDQVFSNTVTRSRQDGLSGTDVSQLAFVPEAATLLIAWQNGNIDLLQDNQVKTLDVLAKANLPEGRKINHILVSGTTAFLAGDFGVLVLNVARQEVRETWRNIGPGGAPVTVYGSTLSNNQFYLATSAGLLTAPATGPNLQDFRSWRLLQEGLPEGSAVAVAALAGKLYVGFEGKGVYILEAGVWQKTDLPVVSDIRSFNVSNNQLILCYANRIGVLKADNSLQIISHPAIISPQEAVMDAAGNWWIADAVNGLISNQEGDFKSYTPNGPLTNQYYKLVLAENDIIALPGELAENNAPLGDTTGFSVFSASGWQNFAPNIPSAQLMPAITDLYTAAYNPFDQNLYLGSYGSGLLVKGMDGKFSLFNEDNSPLQISSEPGGGVRVTGLAVDREGNTWVALYGTAFGQPSLFVRRKDGTWQGFTFTNFVARYPHSLTIDNNGYKWMTLSAAAGGGIWVFDDQANRTRLLTTASGNGGLPNAQVYSLVKDKEGQLWAGTGRGAAVFLNPGNVFSNAGIDAVTPFYERRPLLRDEVITTIAVDGGNRKWFGTRNGLFLFNAAGDDLVAQYNQQNAPLPASAIRDIAIQPVTGEVLVATAAGLVSYRGTATEAPESVSAVKVFPNPVRPNFDGLVGISGVMADAVVKITDVSGRLVYETRAQGGTAVWNVRDYTGRRAGTGIYLIYASDAAGSESLVSKIAVIE